MPPHDPSGSPSRRPRLAIITSQAFSLPNFRGPLIRDMIARGWDVYALAPDYDDEMRAATRRWGAEPVDCPVARTGLNPISDLSYMLHLRRRLRRLQVEAVLCYFVKPVIFGIIVAWLIGVPKRFALIPGLGYAFTEADAGGPTLKRRLLRQVLSRLYRSALARADIVFFQNDNDRDEFVRMGLVERENTRNTYGTGLDLRAWDPAPPIISPVTFTLAARLLRDKGIYEYVEAARRVRRLHPHTRFVLLGGLDGNPAAISEKQVRDWAREGVIEWFGHVPVEPWLRQTSVFVLPSYREGLPRSTQEAMAMARPVITTSAVGCRETVVEGENGFLVPPRDVEALAAAMLRFVEDPSLIGPMGAASRRLVERRFDVRRVNKLMLEAMGL
jgi:glycosyltransferase involved in cell wall biosynthesis